MGLNNNTSKNDNSIPPADKMDVEVGYPGRPAGSPPDNGESLRQDVVQGYALKSFSRNSAVLSRR